jgi:hypothetical protein
MSEKAWIRINGHSLTRSLENWKTAYLWRREEIVSDGEGCVSKEILIKEFQQMFQNLENVKHLYKPHGIGGVTMTIKVI